MKKVFLSLYILLSSSYLFGAFVLKDELGIHPAFHQQVNVLGEELHSRVGVDAYILILKTTDGESLSLVGKRELEKLPSNSLILTFTETEQKVDIVAYPEVLKLFDKEQVLSPFPWSGTILPILGERIKKDVREKYSVALFNGYADIVEQIAESRGVELENSVGNANKYALNSLRVVFYSIIFIALGYMFYRKFLKRREENV